MPELLARFGMSSARPAAGALGVLLAIALLLAGCGSEEPDPDQRLFTDLDATRELSRIRSLQSDGALLTPTDFQALQRLFELHPEAMRVRDAYREALIQRSDWASLETFLLQTPIELQSRDHQLQLARVYAKQGQHQDLLETLAALPASQQASAELVALRATALFGLGRLDEAAGHLDLHWQTLLAERNSDGVAIRGRILLHQGEFEQARDLLKTALAWAPDERGILLALARAHHALGEADPAAAALARADELQARRSAETRRAMHQVELVNALQQYWADQQYPQVIVVARQALQVLDRNHHPVLYEYIVEAHRRLGQEAQAEAALAEQRERLQ